MAGDPRHMRAFFRELGPEARRECHTFTPEVTLARALREWKSLSSFQLHDALVEALQEKRWGEVAVLMRELKRRGWTGGEL